MTLSAQRTYTNWLPVAAIFARQQLPALDNLGVIKREAGQHLTEPLGADVSDEVLRQAQRQQVAVHPKTLNIRADEVKVMNVFKHTCGWDLAWFDINTKLIKATHCKTVRKDNDKLQHNGSAMTCPLQIQWRHSGKRVLRQPERRRRRHRCDCRWGSTIEVSDFDTPVYRAPCPAASRQRHWFRCNATTNAEYWKERYIANAWWPYRQYRQFSVNCRTF